jgi:D-3-phosphoglycerate dehydrogenase
MPKLVVTDSNFPDLSIERGLAANADVELESIQAESPAEVIETASDADGLLTQYLDLPAEVFEGLSNLQVVGRYGIGVDSVDLTAATAANVQVLNVPTYCIDEVSTHALALLLACARKIPQFNKTVKAGGWDWTHGKPIHRLTGSILGLAGFGNVSQELAKKAQALGVDVHVYDPYLSAEEIREEGARKVDFDTLLSDSDFISVHVPLTEETESLFDLSSFSQMKETAILINTARGEVVDVEALSSALDEGEIASAGLDVLPEEPPEDLPLLNREDAILTPHVAWYSEESQIELRRTITEDVLRVLSGETPENLVNSGVV